MFICPIIVDKFEKTQLKWATFSYKYITQAREVFLIQEEFSKFVQGTS